MRRRGAPQRLADRDLARALYHGIGDDADGDGKHDGRVKTGTFGNHAGGEAKVLPEGSDESKSAHQ